MNDKNNEDRIKNLEDRQNILFKAAEKTADVLEKSSNAHEKTADVLMATVNTVITLAKDVEFILKIILNVMLLFVLLGIIFIFLSYKQEIISTWNSFSENWQIAIFTVVIGGFFGLICTILGVYLGRKFPNKK